MPALAEIDREPVHGCSRTYLKRLIESLAICTMHRVNLILRALMLAAYGAVGLLGAQVLARDRG